MSLCTGMYIDTMYIYFQKDIINLIESWHPASNLGFLGDIKLSYKLSTSDKVHI